jgi:Cas7 group CRISPR-associated protein Csh2
MTEIRRATGLLVIEVRNCNPNGDPDRESDPRTRSHDGRGIITGVSFKRKLRDLVQPDLKATDRGDVWNKISKTFKPPLDPDKYHVLENRGRDRGEITKMTKEKFQSRYWDARVFGTTFLESFKDSAEREEKGHFIRTGVVQFGLGLSVAKVRIERMTNTNKSGVQGDKDRGMAPLGDRHVEHGVYCMPFFINPSAADKSGCCTRDIALMLRLLKAAYGNTKSTARNLVEVRHAWYGEHEDLLGSFSEFAFLDALTPSKKDGNNDVPSTLSMDKEYTVPPELDNTLKGKVTNFCDLCDKLPDWCSNV